MTRKRFLLAVLGLMAVCGSANAQSAGSLYTWPGTGDVAGWSTGGANVVTLDNSTAGQLTATETGDLEGPGAPFAAFDGQRRFESSTDIGGLDVTGLTYLEMDIGHNSPTATVDVQFYAKVGPGYLYQWGGSDGLLQGPDWSLGPGMHTLRFPINLLTADQQAYIPEIGVSVRSHIPAGNLTWTISELRTVGTPLTTRDIATHEAGTSEGGLNGVFINYGGAAVVGGTGGQDQVGLAQVSSGGTGALEWTDKGGDGTTGHESGVAIGWVNGTAFVYNGSGNTYYERPASADNYNRVTFRMKATDPLGGGGTIGVQSYFQNEAYSSFQVVGTQDLPVDGAYHDLTFRLDGVTGMRSIDAFGIDVNAHPNNAIIDVDYVRFSTVAGLPGDYNGDGHINAADYVAWRAFPGLFGGNPIGYNVWRSNFGTAGSGSFSPGSVPEPASVVLFVSMALGVVATRRSV